jgi:protein SCO1/2
MTSSPEPHPPAAAGAQAHSRRGWLAAGAAAAAVALAAGSQAPRQPVARGAGAGPGRIPDVPLLTEAGRKVRLYSDLVKGRVVFLNMMYTQCSERCPLMTQSLKRVHEALGARAGRDVFLYSVTLLPEYDRPADLRAYMDLNRIGPGWTFLTGAPADVERLRLGMGFADPDPAVDADIAQHTGLLRVGNDALDRWCMTPILQEPEWILETLMSVDPLTRASGRWWATPA